MGPQHLLARRLFAQPRLQSRDVGAVASHGRRRSRHGLRIAAHSTGAHAVVLVALAVVDGGRRKHLAQHLLRLMVVTPQLLWCLMGGLSAALEL